MWKKVCQREKVKESMWKRVCERDYVKENMCKYVNKSMRKRVCEREYAEESLWKSVCDVKEKYDQRKTFSKSLINFIQILVRQTKKRTTIKTCNYV